MMISIIIKCILALRCAEAIVFAPFYMYVAVFLLLLHASSRPKHVCFFKLTRPTHGCHGIGGKLRHRDVCHGTIRFIGVYISSAVSRILASALAFVAYHKSAVSACEKKLGNCSHQCL